jgi:hypothetical protein
MNQNQILAALSAPFPADQVEFLPRSVNGTRALAIPYLSTAAVMQRLDDVLGLDWECKSQLLPGGCVLCCLRLKVGDTWIERSDIGSPSDQPDAGDKCKAAFSDALKRAAVRFGVGRYLHGIALVWADYDPKARRFVRPPQLPARALPKPPAAEAKPARAG